MALIECPECNTQVSDKAASCPHCGCPISERNTQIHIVRDTSEQARSRGVYIITGLIFGAIGFHNFYSGNNVSGAIKIALVLFSVVLDASTGFYTGFSMVASFITCIWALVEIITVKTDASGKKMT